MSNLTQQELQKISAEIQGIEKLLQSIQKEATDAHKRLDALNTIIRNVASINPVHPVPKKPQPKSQPVPTAADISKYKPFLAPDGWIRNKADGRTYNVPPKVVKMALEATSLKAFFEEFGLQIRDNRLKGGALWVNGSEEFLLPFVGIACRKFSCWGSFTKNGYATGYRIGWFTNCKR